MMLIALLCVTFIFIYGLKLWVHESVTISVFESPFITYPFFLLHFFPFESVYSMLYQPSLSSGKVKVRDFPIFTPLDFNVLMSFRAMISLISSEELLITLISIQGLGFIIASQMLTPIIDAAPSIAPKTKTIINFKTFHLYT